MPEVPSSKKINTNKAGKPDKKKLEKQKANERREKRHTVSSPIKMEETTDKNDIKKGNTNKANLKDFALEMHENMRKKQTQTLSTVPQFPFENSPVYNIFSSAQQKLMDPFNKMQESINSTRDKLMTAGHKMFDISDKVAAVVYEKEKDIRDKLSDTYKRTQVNVYNLLEKVDTSMEQKDHSKEKKTKDQEQKKKKKFLTTQKEKISNIIKKKKSFK